MSTKPTEEDFKIARNAVAQVNGSHAHPAEQTSMLVNSIARVRAEQRESCAQLLDKAAVFKQTEIAQLKAVNWSTLELEHYAAAFSKAAAAIRSNAHVELQSVGGFDAWWERRKEHP